VPWIRRYPVPSAFLLLSIIPLIVVVVSYGQLRSHPIGWFGVALVLGLTLAVVPLRRRWAWWIVVALQAFGILSILWEGVWLLVWAYNLVLLGLVLSPQMRSFIAERQRVSWQRSQR
jgi:hypothetical protein